MHTQTVKQIRTALSSRNIKGVSVEELNDAEKTILGATFSEPLNKEQKALIVNYIQSSKKNALIPGNEILVEVPVQDAKLSFTSQDTQIQDTAPTEAPTQESALSVSKTDPKYQMTKSTAEGYGLQLSESEIEILFTEVDSRTDNMSEFLTELAQIVNTMATEVRADGLSKIEQIKDYYRIRMESSMRDVQQAADALIGDVIADLGATTQTLKKSTQNLKSLNTRLQQRHQERMEKSEKLHQERMNKLTSKS